MKLYIIGNGFDLYHALPSGYGNFKTFLKEADGELYEKIENHYDYDGNFWYAFEENLSNLDEFGILNYVHAYLGSDGWDADALQSYEPFMEHYTFSMLYSLKENMNRWVKNLNLHRLSKKDIGIDRDSLFLNFNYTNTLERRYNIHPNLINYIHGNGQEENCNFVLGHDVNELELNYKVDDNHEGHGRLIIQSYLKYSRKPVEKIIKIICFSGKALWCERSSYNWAFTIESGIGLTLKLY